MALAAINFVDIYNTIIINVIAFAKFHSVDVEFVQFI